LEPSFLLGFFFFFLVFPLGCFMLEMEKLQLIWSQHASSHDL
jgi:hypothetical protein